MFISNFRKRYLIELTSLQDRELINGECKTKEKIDYIKVKQKLNPIIEESKKQIDKIINL